ncbi:hypothetical protein [Microbacterium aureliae]
MDGMMWLQVAAATHRQRQAELEQEHRTRRLLADRGAALVPERPVVQARPSAGLWFRPARPVARARYL